MSDAPQPTADASTPAEGESFFKPEIVFEDFARVDLRVAKVLEAKAHPNADKLLVLKLDDGSGTPRQICAGMSDMGGYTWIVVHSLRIRHLAARPPQRRRLRPRRTPRATAR